MAGRRKRVARAKPERAASPLVDRLAATLPPAGKKAQTEVAAWLTSISRTTEGKSLKALLGASPTLANIIEGIAEGSSHLWDLASNDPGRLRVLLEADPDTHFGALLTYTAAAARDTDDEAEVMRLLRRMKAEAALLISLADIGGVWPVMQVTHRLTELADTSLAIALRFLIAGASERGLLRPASHEEPEVGAGLFVLAMGKMGAFELNYSSDIDLIVLYDVAAPALAPDVEPTPLYVRITRGLVKLLQERTADGYVFRVDLRLRPDPGSTQIAVSTASALSYYESIGQNWERAALIKARPCAGDIAAGEAFLRELTPFIWRKYLDFVAVADVHAMKRQIHAYRGHDEIAVEGHNVKLGRGGIREIEFFVQTQQLIAGGRHPELRGHGTLEMLTALTKGGWIGAPVADDLAAAYGFLRSVEHRLQMVADEQTHTLPADAEELERFARFLGYANRDAFAQVLLDHLRKVQRHYASLFEDVPAGKIRHSTLSFEKENTETLDALLSMGYRRPLEAFAAIRGWLSGSHRALKSEVAHTHLAELAPLIVERFARSEDPDAALRALDRFFGSLSRGARFLSLLRQNPDLVSLIALILGTAPRLADILARQPQAMDALIDPAFFGTLPDEAKLEQEMTAALAQAVSFEDLLDRARIFGQEQMFLIGARILSRTLAAAQAGEAFARLADVVIRALHRAIEKSIASLHGRLRGQESAVLAMGKLGGREMTAGSDLDLIIVYDFDDERPESDGERPLYGGQYFARLTQRLIGALTTPTNYGSLYLVDMRLRPSGRSGPLATKLDSFASYQQDEAWTWEHMALTRARVVSGSPAFTGRVTEVIQAVLSRPRDPATTAADVVEMRRAIAAEKGDDQRWDLRNAAGGLVDLEFIAQYLQLAHAEEESSILDISTARAFEKACRADFISAGDTELLRGAAQLYNDLTQILRLCLAGPFEPKKAGQGLLDLLARAADVPDFATLEAHLIETQDKVRAAFTRILGDAP